MKNYTLLKEHPDHFLLHDGVAAFKVAKHGLGAPAMDKIRAFAHGGSPTHADGSTRAGDKTQAINEKLMGQINKKIGAKGYAEGGEAEEQKESFKLEEPAQTDLNEVYKPTELPEPEKVEKRRQIEVEMPEPEAHAEGGSVNQPKDDIKPMEEIQMMKHGQDVTSPQDRGEYSAMKQLKKESPSLPMYDDGGTVSPTQTFQDSFRKATHYADGGTAEQPSTLQKIGTAIKQGFESPKPSPTPSDEDQRQSKYDAIRQQNSENMKGGSSYAEGGHVHHNGGKNQLHFHFYDGATVPTQLDKEEGAGPQQSSALDKYVGGEPQKLADGGEPSVNLSAQDIDPNAPVNVPQNVNPNTPQTQNSDSPTPEQSANNLASAMGQPTPFDNSSNNSIPPAQQVSAVPKASAPTPDQNPNMLSDFDKNLALEKQGIEQGAAAQTQGYKDTAQALGEHQLQQQKINDDYKLASDALTQQNQQLFDAVKDNKIDPNHFWNNKTTPGKIAATIGLLLGGIGGGLDQTHQNKALIMLQQQIADDIESQKVDNSNKMNLYKMGLEKYRDVQAATQFATLQSNALLQGNLQKIGAQTGSAQAGATATSLIGQLGVQNAGIRSELAMKQAAIGAMNSPAPTTGVDNNKLRLLVSAGVIPKEEVPAAMKEYGDYQKLGNILSDTDKTFDIGRKNANWRQAILPHWTPDMTQASIKYNAAVDNFLGKITKETEGRVTPADVELMRSSMPKLIDGQSAAEQKLNTVKDQIREKYSFPTLGTYKLLHPHDPVATPSSVRSNRFTEGPPK